MSFVSSEFLIFFVFAVSLYFVTPYKFRWALLLIASYIFYTYWNAHLIILILLSTFIDYTAGLYIDRTPQENQARRRILLAISMLSNLGILFTFKYYNFFASSLVDLLHTLNITADINTLQLILPVGISFYTFQSMSYTIDVYKGNIKAERHAGIFALYVAFFPQLVAGPIERASNMLEQFKQNYDFDYVRVVEGLRLALWGFFKKVVIADRLAPYVNQVYNNTGDYSGITLILATVFFAIQIYCDFSGYSDIAIGTAKVMGFKLMDNFHQPYLAKSIREFWRRWHISLSTWFRDYVYFPLGGNRVGLPRTLVNLMIVFVASGLWHGANWTFVIWGTLHGGYIVIETLWTTWMKRLPENRRISIPSVISWLLTLILVLIAWVFFRANSFDDAMYVIGNMFNFSDGTAVFMQPFEVNSIIDPTTNFILAWIGIGILLLFDYVDNWKGMSAIFARWRLPLRWGLYYALIFAIIVSLLLSSTVQDFIYFQF